MHAERTTPTERRTRILCAMEDGQYRVGGIAAWADLSDQQTRADLKWLAREGFAIHGELDDGEWCDITSKGREYLAGLSDEEKTW